MDKRNTKRKVQKQMLRVLGFRKLSDLHNYKITTLIILKLLNLI